MVGTLPELPYLVLTAACERGIPMIITFIFKKAEVGIKGQTNLQESLPVVNITGDSADFRNLHIKHEGAFRWLIFGFPRA